MNIKMVEHCPITAQHSTAQCKLLLHLCAEFYTAQHTIYLLLILLKYWLQEKDEGFFVNLKLLIFGNFTYTPIMPQRLFNEHMRLQVFITAMDVLQYRTTYSLCI